MTHASHMEEALLQSHWRLTSLLRPSAMTILMPGFLPSTLIGATARGCTCAPSTSQPAAIFSKSCRLGCCGQVTTYSFVSPEDGCCTFCAQIPVQCSHSCAFRTLQPSLPVSVQGQLKVHVRRWQRWHPLCDTLLLICQRRLYDRICMTCLVSSETVWSPRTSRELDNTCGGHCPLSAHRRHESKGIHKAENRQGDAYHRL